MNRSGNSLIASLMGDLWCMEPGYLSWLAATLTEGAPVESLAAGVAYSPGSAGVVPGNPGGAIEAEDLGPVAVIPIHGVMMKRVPAVFSMLGIEATGTVETAAAIEAALADPTIESIELDIDSPGGSIAGVSDLADLVWEAGNIKPIRANIEDLAASAAYWVGSQAGEIHANPGALIGSIGVYRVMVDSSKAAENDGIKVHLINSGPHKGAGVPGTEITGPMVERERRLINQAAEMFTDAVARGRGMTQEAAADLATGEAWFSAEAQSKDLIDIITRAEPSAALQPADFGGEEVRAMEETTVEPAAIIESAPIDEMETLKAALALAENQLADRAAADLATKAALAQVVENQKTAIIEGAIDAGRVTPAMVTEINAYADFCGDDVEKLGGFISTLPVQTRAAVESAHPVQEDRPLASLEDQRVAKLLGIDPGRMETEGTWASIDASGNLIDEKGAIISAPGGLN